MTLFDVYQQLRECTGRDDLARLGTAIFAHERGPRGYEAGYGYTDKGALPQWEGRQIEGVCGELKRYFGRTRPVNYSTLQSFWREEWKASDPNWAAGVWRQYQGIVSMPSTAWGDRLAGRSEAPKKPYLGVEEKLRGSLSANVQDRLSAPTLDQNARRWLIIGLGMIGLAWVWSRGRLRWGI